jgi:enamine deaminase RidA (YjgF/YER057c/UK114 family)
MKPNRGDLLTVPDTGSTLSDAALAEWKALGFEDIDGVRSKPLRGLDAVGDRPMIPKRAISAPEVLNEAYAYSKPSSFTRGMRVELPGASVLYLSGTASIDEAGRTVFEGDFQAQCLRTFRNLTGLLAAEDASWHDVVRTTCYLRDIDRDYGTFNEVRTLFLNAIPLDPLPASTGIQAHLCRPDLLIEIEAIAIVPRGETG